MPAKTLHPHSRDAAGPVQEIPPSFSPNQECTMEGPISHHAHEESLTPPGCPVSRGGWSEADDTTVSKTQMWTIMVSNIDF